MPLHQLVGKVSKVCWSQYLIWNSWQSEVFLIFILKTIQKRPSTCQNSCWFLFHMLVIFLQYWFDARLFPDTFYLQSLLTPPFCKMYISPQFPVYTGMLFSRFFVVFFTCLSWCRFDAFCYFSFIHSQTHAIKNGFVLGLAHNLARVTFANPLSINLL